MSEFALLLRIASRNIFASFLNVIIGLIILAGTLFFVVGGSLVNSMDSAMSRSIIGSVAGNAQIYAADSKDAPAIFDNWNLPDLEAIPDFSKVKAPLMQDPNIKAVVPMGISTAIVAYGNTVDQALEKLRNGLTHKPLAPRVQIESLKSHVRQIIKIIQGDYAKLSVVADKKSIDAQATQDLAQAASDEFWGSFDASPLSHLEFLENKIASLVPDADQIFLSYVGTDLQAYQSAFDRMQIVDGTAVPKGQRGMLLSKYVYENQFKLKIANRLDKIHEALTEKGKLIAKDPDLQDLVKQNKTQTREIILQLDPLSLQKAVVAMQAATGSRETDVAKLLPLFLDTNDENFEARYKAFYADLAPLIELYRLKPGDILTIKAYTKSGFVQAVNIKVYGTFQFKGLEKSGLAGALSLMDLMSFRDLYGYVTPEKIAETKALEKEAGAKAIAREDVEADLFGGSNASVVGNATQTKIDDKAQLGDAREVVQSASLINRVYSQDEIEKGVAIQAAIILKDPSRLKQTMADIQAASDKDKLNLKVVDWQKAAGNIGQFVFVVKLVLGIATAIIFVVALVIINNAVVMATLQRVREIGTLRAIGAQRAFVLSMVLTETVALGLAFGAVGALLGSGIVAWLGHAGIPAGNEFLYFFFSGPRLYPSVSAGSLVGAFIVVLIVTCASALYPAIMATRVSPIQAMASED
jgi:ABC-type lipoprotein release transport system permease subunit